jgi:flagellar motor switch protein FliM
MLQQADIDGLLAALAASQDTDAAHARRYAEVRLYDFAHPDAIPSEFLPLMENVNATYAERVTPVFMRFVSGRVRVLPLSIEQMTYAHYCHAVPEHTAACSFSLTPLDGLGIFELNAHLAWYLMDCALGGPGEVLTAPRAFSPMLRGLLDDLNRRMLRELALAWSMAFPALAFSSEDFLTDLTQARLYQPGDQMLVCSFEVTLGSVIGCHTFAVPIISLPFTDLQGGPLGNLTEATTSPDEDHAQLLGQVAQAPLALRACLPDQIMPLSELASLHLGDTIFLDSSPSEHVTVFVGDQPLLTGHAVTVQDRLCIEVISDAEENAR